jgi:Tetratricopeptide repeat
VATDIKTLATLLYDTNRPGEAEPLFRQALATDEKSYGPDHLTVARDLHSLAFALHD